MNRRRPIATLAVLTAALGALLAPHVAEAGYGVQPIGQTLPVTTSQSGSIVDPQRLDFLVSLDPRDSEPFVWVSDSPAIGAAGMPLGSTLGSCRSGDFRPWSEPGKLVCSVSTASLRPGRTYHWWLDYRRLEDGASSSQKAISGPFSFALAQSTPPAANPPAVTPPAAKPPTKAPAAAPTVRQSTKTFASAATLPAARRYTGERSVKHQTLTDVIYGTMKALGAPRTLAVGCWSEFDFAAVARSADFSTQDGDIHLAGFWLGRQPRWLHLAPSVCDAVQELLDTRRPTAERAFGLTVALHETLHAYGIANEAQTNCFAVQLVPFAARHAGMSRTSGDHLRRLAINVTRRSSPPGYWSGGRCRDDGPWDLFPETVNLR
ncbi:MAG: hypothetical protein M3Q92_02235 [Actinomycetota bacterium]|nr:hypothetical protein [Actinomycetota bacterium]